MKIANINKAYLGNNIINRIGNSFVYMGDGVAPSVCPVVIPSITGYEGGEMEVYALDDEKWYEMNNLGQYEEYGIMPTINDLSTVTTYKGKLVIYNHHEWEYDGTQWVDLGNAGTSRLIDSPSYIYNDSNHLFSIPLNYTASTDTKYEMDIVVTSSNGGMIIAQYNTSDQDDYRFFSASGYLYYDVGNGRIYKNQSIVNQTLHLEVGNYYIRKNGQDYATGATRTFQRDSMVKLGYQHSHDGDTSALFQLSGLTMYHGEEKTRDFIPAIDNGEVCIFDKVSGEFYKSDNNKYPLSGGTIQQVEVGTIVPIKEYEEKPEIETEVTVLELSDIQCPFEGMIAHVGDLTYTYVDGEWVEGHHFTNLISGTFTGSTAPTFKVNEQKVTASTTGNNFSYYVAPGTCTSLKGFRSGSTFSDNITSINFDIDTSNCTSFEMVLRENTKITSVTGIPNLNTDKVQNVRGFFNRCSGIQSVDVTGLVTSACTNIDGCFYFAANLTNIVGLETWDVSNVTTVGGLFGNTKITSLYLSGWDLSRAGDVTTQTFVNVNTLTDVYMHGCNNTTLNKIKGALYNKGICTIHRDGKKYNYVNGQWVETDDN